jgi:endonuclease/exonuclease/phosphatase family metal-dependent hydrolase
MLAAIHPDILGVCEIGTAEDLADLQQRLQQAGVDLPYTEMAHGGDETRRLALLSRLPIKARNSQTTLTYQIGAQTLPFQRGILDVTIAITPTFDLHLLGVHLKSMRTIPDADQAEMRRNEARLLRLHMDSLFAQEPGARILAYGDFNAHRNDPTVAKVMGSPRTGDTTMLDVLLRDANGEVWTHFWDAADVYSRLDYCFTSRLLRPHIDTRNSYIHSEHDFHKASDHRPLVLKIRAEVVLK